VPAGDDAPSATDVQAFSGPVISVSQQFTHSSNGNTFGYNIIAGTPSWSFQLNSLGAAPRAGSDVGCPIVASFATNPTDLGSFTLFDGDACLPVDSGIAPAQGTRSALQIDGLNAYPPGSITALSGAAGFQPLVYNATWSPSHETVAVTETDLPVICNPPGGYPPTPTSCPSLANSGIAVQQTTAVLPGGQVVRVAQRYVDLDRKPHTLDVLVSQSIGAFTRGQIPGFEFPGQSVFATHAAPDAFSTFPGGPGTIYVVANAATPPATSNPTGAITYGQPPLQADFITAAGAQRATFVMHYVIHLAAGGTATFDWSYSQASDAAGLAPLVHVERDRFFTPTLRLRSPRNGSVARNSPIVVTGVATETVGITSVSVNGRGAILGAAGRFRATISLHTGRNTIRAIATNVAGNRSTALVTVLYKPAPCRVPNLRGRTVGAARTLLPRHGCALGRVTGVRTKAVRKGRIVSTRPAHGTRHRHGTKVRVVVSRGR
jgi:hypothetical protein